MPYLFQVNIGPVQPLLRNVRQTCDLQFSSSLLSELSYITTWTLSELQKKPERLIFPAIPLEQHVYSGLLPANMPDKILAYIENDTPFNVVANQVKNDINDAIDRIWNEIFLKIKAQFNRREANLQIIDLIEYRWAAISFHREYDNYAETRRKLDALMTARKNTCDFAPVSWGSELPKSPTSGLLESVIPEYAYPPSLKMVKQASGEYQERLKAEYKRKSEALRLHFDAGPHEKLSGVDLFKRLGSIKHDNSELQHGLSRTTQRVPNTSHIAALPFLQGLTFLTEKQRNEWRETYFRALEAARDRVYAELDMLPGDYWDHVFTPGEFDSALLYPFSFSHLVDVAEIAQEAQEEFQKVKLALEGSFDTLGLHPDPYYALLTANGDSMENLIDYQAQAGMKQHQQLSAALAGFAVTVPQVISRYSGICIYACGDDILALLPLHTALQCARELADNFRNSLATFKTWYQRSPTLSAGLAVIHHLYPLGDALQVARQAVKRAKSGDKNALAITLQRLDGPVFKTGGSWGSYDQRLEQQITFYQQPPGVCHRAEQCYARERALYVPPEQDPYVVQAYGQDSKMPFSQEMLRESCCPQYILDEIDLARQAAQKRTGLEHQHSIHGENLVNELLIARLFANARRLARGDVSYKGEQV